MNFADRLADAVRRCRTPVVVGLDPRLESLPGQLQVDPQSASPSQIAWAYQTFCKQVIDVVAPLVPAVKPQAAFFEQVGPEGMSALADVVHYGQEKGLLVILDGKRNDIGSTAQAYAKAYLGRRPASSWGADALTVSPYLGTDSLSPFVEAARREDAGLFVLVKTSNPGGGLFQDLVVQQRPLYAHVADHVEQLSAACVGRSGYGPIGGVVGATYPEQLDQLRRQMRHCWLLVPGFGAQGGSASDVAGAFDEQGLGAVINSSRAIIFAYQRPEYRDTLSPDQWQGAVEAATREMIQQLSGETAAGRLGK